MSIQHSITQNPEFALVTVQLEAGQKIYSEPGAMASMDTNIKLTANLQGGVFGSIKRKLGGESLIMSTYEAEGSSGELTLAAGQPGDVRVKSTSACRPSSFCSKRTS